MNERDGAMMNERKKKRQVSIGGVVVAVIIAFVAGNRLQTIGDYFFAPYTNKGNQALSQRLDFTEVNKIYGLLKQRFDGKLTNEKLQEGLSRGLVEAAGDPYTVYLSPSEAESFAADLNGTFSGIGAELGKRDDRVVIIAPLDGSPAQKAGVRSGDAIVQINGEDATTLSVDAAVDKIRGESGTKVKLQLLRSGSTIDVEITRASISVPSVKSEILEGNIGYLKVSRFSNDTAELANQAARNFKDKNVKAVVLDVRDNGGGLLDTAVDLAGLWLDNKVVVSERQGGNVTQELRSGNNPILGGIPTTVLINGGSASASEILAGALKDHGVATLLGGKSFGKGSVQELIELDGGAQLKVTIAHWYTPKGVNIDKKGIEPDVKVEFTDEDFEAGRDPQKDRALQQLR